MCDGVMIMVGGATGYGDILRGLNPFDGDESRDVYALCVPDMWKDERCAAARKASSSTSGAAACVPRVAWRDRLGRSSDPNCEDRGMTRVGTASTSDRLALLIGLASTSELDKHLRTEHIVFCYAIQVVMFFLYSRYSRRYIDKMHVISLFISTLVTSQIKSSKSLGKSAITRIGSTETLPSPQQRDHR